MLTAVTQPQTLMSTDIFQQKYMGHSDSNPSTRLSPLQFYLALAIPLTVVTLLVWAIFHFFETRREKQKEQLIIDPEYGA